MSVRRPRGETGIFAVITSIENLKNIDRYRQIGRRIELVLKAMPEGNLPFLWNYNIAELSTAMEFPFFESQKPNDMKIK